MDRRSELSLCQGSQCWKENSDEIVGYTLFGSETFHHFSTFTYESRLSFINSSSIPFARDIKKIRESPSVVDSGKYEKWKIIAPPSREKGGSTSGKHDLEEKILPHTFHDCLMWGPQLENASKTRKVENHPILIPSLNQKQFMMTSSTAVKPTDIPDVKIHQKKSLSPLVEVVIGLEDFTETRIAGIVYSHNNEDESDNMSTVSEVSWNST